MSNLIALSGAALRDAAAKGDTLAQAELDRRMAKRTASGKVTVAALRSWGRTTEADAKVAAAKPAPKAKAAKAPAPVITPVVQVPNRADKAVAFTRTHEVVEAKSAIGHLHNRMCNVEQALARMAASQERVEAMLARIAK